MNMKDAGIDVLVGETMNSLETDSLVDTTNSPMYVASLGLMNLSEKHALVEPRNSPMTNALFETMNSSEMNALVEPTNSPKTGALVETMNSSEMNESTEPTNSPKSNASSEPTNLPKPNALVEPTNSPKTNASVETMNLSSSETDALVDKTDSEDTVVFQVGLQFGSFLEFRSKYRKYCEEKNISFLRLDSRTVETQNKKLSNSEKPFAPSLVYSRIKFACNFFGESSTVKRRMMDRRCQAHISLCANKTRDKLKIKTLNEEHFHSNNGTPASKKIPKKTLKRAAPPPHNQNHEASGGIKNRKRGIPESLKSKRSYSNVSNKNSTALCRDEESGMPSASSTTSTSIEQYYPPHDQSNRTESSSIECLQRVVDSCHSNNTRSCVDASLATGILQDNKGDKNDLTVDADDLFFLSMATEVKNLSRSEKLNVKMKIMEAISSSLQMYSR